MSQLSEKQVLQESYYEFPYHHIPTFDQGDFSQVRFLKSGYEYLSYILFVLERIAALNFDSLLDVGCGDGKFLFEALRRFPGKKFVGLDYSEQAIRYAKAMNPTIECVCGDISNTGLLEDHFDVITLIETLEHIPPGSIPAFVKGLHHYLHNDGTLVLTVPSKNTRRIDARHYQHFDLESLSQTLQPFFIISETHFINSRSVWAVILQQLLGNPLFILNEQHLINIIYHTYERYFLEAQRNTGKRICALCRKGSSTELPAD